jgi:hypothetical protein
LALLHARVETIDPGSVAWLDCADTDVADCATLIWPVA